ncbi:hypothetical protein ACFLQN_03690 [Candidatus Aenigmatarchaeota archaeon]
METGSKKEIKNITKNQRNVWMYSTFGLVIILIIVVALSLSMTPTGAVTVEYSDQQAADRAMEFINGNLVQEGNTAELISIEEERGLYKIKISLNGQELDTFFTKDLNVFIPQAVEVSDIIEQKETPPQETPTEPVPTEIPKSDKPIVELFVMSHCPYGTQAEKGIIPVVNLLGDKIDFSLKYVYYAMHPTQGEVEEQLLQYCIQEENNDKFLDYLACFLEAGDTNDCLGRVGIARADLETCISETDEQFEIMTNLEDTSLWLNGRFPQFNIHKDLNEQYGIGGSPSLVVNGLKVSSGRAPAALQSIICSAFNTPPEECSEQLDAANPSPGFGYTPGSVAASDAGVCG